MKSVALDNPLASKAAASGSGYRLEGAALSAPNIWDATNLRLGYGVADGAHPIVNIAQPIRLRSGQA